MTMSQRVRPAPLIAQATDMFAAKASRYPLSSLWIIVSIILTVWNAVVESQYLLILILLVQLGMAFLAINDLRKRLFDGK